MRRSILFFLSFLLVSCSQDLQYQTPVNLTQVVGTAQAEVYTSIASSVTLTPPATSTVTFTPTLTPTATATAALTAKEMCNPEMIQRKYDDNKGIRPDVVVTSAEYIKEKCEVSMTFINPVSDTYWYDKWIALPSLIDGLIPGSNVVTVIVGPDWDWTYKRGDWTGAIIGVTLNIPDSHIEKTFKTIVKIREEHAKATSAALSQTSTITPTTTKTPTPTATPH